MTGQSLPSTITYVCVCGHVMIVSVKKVNQECDETKTCDECGEQVPWDEFTVDGEGDPPWIEEEA